MRAASNTKPTSGSIAALVLAVVLLPLLALVLPPRLDLPCGCSSFSRRCRARTRSSGRISGSGPINAASKALEAQQAERAAELFENPEWRSAAQYRAEQFEASAASLANIDSAAGHYNRGNALAKAGQLPAAIAAYDRALELDPSHEDARYNRDLAAAVPRGQSASSSKNRKTQGEQGQQGDSDQSQSQSGEQQDGGESADEQQSEQGEQGESGDSQAAEGAQDPLRGTERRRAAGRGEARADANAGEEAARSDGGRGRPEDVEQWASEQAAEQWLRRVPQDPGGLLRRKFLYQYQRLGVDQRRQSRHRRGGGGAAAVVTTRRRAAAGALCAWLAAVSGGRVFAQEPIQATVDRAVVRDQRVVHATCCAPRAPCAAIPRPRRWRRSSTS